MVPTDVANLALGEAGQRVRIASLSGTYPASAAAGLFYTPKTQALLRTANWDFARAQATLTVWKQAIVNGVASSTPPPQPFFYSYLWPTDCLKARFLLPTVPVAAPGTPLTTAQSPLARGGRAPTATPFVPATDLDANGNPIKVILTNLPHAQLIYTRDLSQVPDLWDSLFLSADTAFLATFFINALARNAAQYQQQVATSQGLIAQARLANGNEGIESVDHTPDWLSARRAGGSWWGWNSGDAMNYAGGNDPVTYSCGLSF